MKNNFIQMKNNFATKIMSMDEKTYYEFWDMISENFEYNGKLNDFSDCTLSCYDCKEKYGECGSDMPCYERYLRFCKDNSNTISETR